MEFVEECRGMEKGGRKKGWRIHVRPCQVLAAVGSRQRTWLSEEEDAKERQSSHWGVQGMLDNCRLVFQYVYNEKSRSSTGKAICDNEKYLA